MKSDREFLQEVYKKAEKMKFEKQTVNDTRYSFKKFFSSLLKKKSADFRVAVVTAVFLLMVTSGVIINNLTMEKEKVTPTPYNLIPRGLPSTVAVPQLWDNVTDVIEIQNSDNGGPLNIVYVYKGHTGEEVLLDKINKDIAYLEQNQSAIVLLQVTGEDMNILDVYYLDIEDGTYKNLSDSVLTKEELEELFQE